MATDVGENVNSILESIRKNTSRTIDEDSILLKEPINDVLVKKVQNKNKVEEIRGKPKSNRFWKSKKEKFSKIVKTKGIRPDFQAKTALRIELKRTKNMSHQLLQQMKEKELLRKERRRENLKRAEENKRKSEIVQVITNTKKLKRMKKKQLRFIEKRDINNENKSIK